MSNNTLNSAHLTANIAPSLNSNSSIIVVGAGAFGGWTSLMLQRKGFKVTNIDLWGPGNSRSSSGGETRLLRYVYGIGSIYTDLAYRAYRLWLENEKKFNTQLFYPTGALWLVNQQSKSGFINQSLAKMTELGLEYERLSPKEAATRYPMMEVSDLSEVILEKQAGYLLAREACEQVIKAFIAAGGSFIQGQVLPGAIVNNKLNSVLLNDTRLEADAYVFACGPWINKILPGFFEPNYKVTRQEVFYFGLPGDVVNIENQLPPWLDPDGDDMYYGFPSNQRRGFKVASHRQGKAFDPTTDNRAISNIEVLKARKYLDFRFPSLKNLPLVESRVCQYSNTPDEHFIFDQHPEADNAWILGGGSGHGFKHGPALGELSAKVIAGETTIPQEFLLKRFNK